VDSQGHPISTVNLSSFSDGTITSSLAVSDPAGNQFSASGNAVTLEETLTIPAGQTVTLNGGTLQASFIDVEGTVIGFGTIIANVITNNGTITAKSNHTLTIEISGSIQGTGLLEITNNTTLTLDGPVGSGQTVQFDIGNGPAPKLVLNDPSHFQGQITGFQGSDTIDLPTIHFDSGTTATFTGGILTIKEGTTTVAAITFVGSPNLKIASDGHGGTLISDPPASTTTTNATTTTDASTTTTDATVAPVAKTSTLTATKTTSSQTKATSATVTETPSSPTNATSAAADEAIMVALNTAVAVAVALDTAVADPDSGKMSSLTISGDGTAVDITGTVSGSDSSTVNSGAALGFSPISHRMAETLTDNGTVEVINGKPAGTVSETGAFKIDAGAALQLEGSDAVNGLARTDGTNADAINLPGDHTIKAAWHVSDDGRGSKTAHNAPASETGEDPSAQSTSADNHFGVSSPFTETPGGNGDHSASAFKLSVDHHATVDPGINLASVPKDHLLQHPADNLLHIPAQADHEADPAHPHVDGNRSANVKFAGDGNAPSGALPSDPSTLTALPSDPSGAHGPAARALAPGDDTPVQPTPAGSGHHWGTDPDIKFASIPQNNPPQHPADNSLHAPAQQDDDGSPAATDGAHPGRGQDDGSQPASPKFADDGSAHPGKVPHDPPAPTALSSDLSGDDSAQPFKTNFGNHANANNHPLQQPADNSLHTATQHDDNGSPAATDGAHPGRGQGDGSEQASPKFADVGGAHSAHTIGEDTSVQSTPADNDHHAIADPGINLASIAKNDLPQHPADNSLHMPAQLDDGGVLTTTDGAHPAHPQVDGNQLDTFKFADDGSPQLAHATGEDTSVLSTPADNGHHSIADPEINLASIAPNQPPEHPADNLPPTPAQPDDGPHPTDSSVDVNEVPSFKFADNGSDHGTGPDGAHPAHPQVDGNQSDSFKFADGGDHPGMITNDPTAVTAPSGDSSGTHGPAAPTLAKTFDVPDAGISAAPDQFVFADNAGHGPGADHKPDVIEIDHTVAADIQQVLDTAHETNAVSALDPNHATASQDMTKVQPHHQGDFHFA